MNSSRFPSLTLSLALAVAIFALALPASANKKERQFVDRNPCHSNKNAMGKDVTCTRVVVPPMMCSACQLKQTFSKATGKFQYCHDVYDLSTAECRRQLRYYADRNKNCDPVRWAQTRDMDKEENREGLDYFLYSVCEQCCDCIPRGSTEQQWWVRKRDQRNFNENRGNCPAHGFYDICKIWPKVKFLSGPRGWEDDKNATTLCTDLTKWRRDPRNRDWLYSSTSYTTTNVQNFFKRFFKVVNCQRNDVWKPCVKLETAQGRLNLNNGPPKTDM